MLNSPWPDLDAVLEASPRGIVARRGTAIAEDYYEHHFPGQPIVPAVLMISWLEHAAGVLVAHQSGGKHAAILQQLPRATCIRIATPGDRLIVHVSPDPPIDPAALVAGATFAATGVVMRDGERVLRARLVLQVVLLSAGPASWLRIAAELGLSGVDDEDRQS